MNLWTRQSLSGLISSPTLLSLFVGPPPPHTHTHPSPNYRPVIVPLAAFHGNRWIHVICVLCCVLTFTVPYCKSYVFFCFWWVPWFHKAWVEWEKQIVCKLSQPTMTTLPRGGGKLVHTTCVGKARINNNVNTISRRPYTHKTVWQKCCSMIRFPHATCLRSAESNAKRVPSLKPKQASTHVHHEVPDKNTMSIS